MGRYQKSSVEKGDAVEVLSEVWVGDGGFAAGEEQGIALLVVACAEVLYLC